MNMIMKKYKERNWREGYKESINWRDQKDEILNPRQQDPKDANWDLTEHKKKHRPKGRGRAPWTCISKHMGLIEIL